MKLIALTARQVGRLHQLATVINNRNDDDNDGDGIVGTGLKLAGAGAAIYGGVKAGGAISDKMEALKSGPGSRAFKQAGTLGQVGKATKAVGGDIWDYLKQQGKRLVEAGALDRVKTLSAQLDAVELGVFGEMGEKAQWRAVGALGAASLLVGVGKHAQKRAMNPATDAQKRTSTLVGGTAGAVIGGFHGARAAYPMKPFIGGGATSAGRMRAHIAGKRTKGGLKGALVGGAIGAIAGRFAA